MMRVLVYAGLLAASLMAEAAAPDGFKLQLRQLLKLPTVTLEAGFQFNPEEGFGIWADKSDPRDEIVRLEKELVAGPRDPAPILLQLAKLYGEAGDSAKASSAGRRAVEFYRRQAEDGTAASLMKLSEALGVSGEYSEAEKALRRAVAVGGEDWPTWVALGQFLNGKARRAIMPSGPPTGPDQASVEANPSRPSAERISEARGAQSEAGEAFDRAITLAPAEVQPRLQRAFHKSATGFVEAFVENHTTPIERKRALTRGTFTPACLPDLRQAALIGGKNFQALATAALMESCVRSIQNGALAQGFATWAQLPEDSREFIREVLTRLEDLAQASDSSTAAGACEALGIVQTLVMEDPIGSVANLRRAVRLDPNREQSWDLLTGLLAEPGSYGELVVLCEERSRHKATGKNYLLLAKAYEKREDLERCEEALQQALRFQPGHFLANLAMAAVLLKGSDDTATLTQAKDHLLKAARAGARDKSQALDFFVTLAIYHATSNNLEEARRVIKQAASVDAEDDRVKELVALLETAAEQGE